MFWCILGFFLHENFKEYCLILIFLMGNRILIMCKYFYKYRYVLFCLFFFSFKVSFKKMFITYLYWYFTFCFVLVYWCFNLVCNSVVNRKTPDFIRQCWLDHFQYMHLSQWPWCDMAVCEVSGWLLQSSKNSAEECFYQTWTQNYQIY